MKTLNAIQIAELAVLSGNGATSMLVLELHNGGGSQNWGRQFPSLTSEQLDMIDETAFFECDTRKEACDLFQQLTADCGENGTGGLIGGRITLVIPHAREDDEVETITWKLDEKTRPVLEGTVWKDELIVDRI